MGKIREMSPQEIRRMQLLQLDMLKELDRVCRQNGILYTISDGTLLGAVRHKGYIPWDDDADISMLREEYEKFKKVSGQLDPRICYFQDHDTDSAYRWGYGKLRRTGTKYIRAGQEHLKCKTGVFIDIFPMDDIPLSIAGQILNHFYDFLLREVLYSEVGKLSPQSGAIERFLYERLSRIDIDQIFLRIDKMAKRSKNNSPNRVRLLTMPPNGAPYTKNPLKERFGMPKSWFTDLDEYEFEGVKFFGSRDYDAVLRYDFGPDYMKFPPMEQRKSHAPASDYSF